MGKKATVRTTPAQREANKARYLKQGKENAARNLQIMAGKALASQPSRALMSKTGFRKAVRAGRETLAIMHDCDPYTISRRDALKFADGIQL